MNMLITADWIFLGIIVGGLLLGMLIGFGKLFKFFTSGIFGIILSIIVCFLIGFAFYGTMEPLLDKLADKITSVDNWFCQFLGKLQIQKVLYYVIMFIVVWLLRFIVVRIIKGVAESNNKAIKAVNRVLGGIFFVACLLLIAILALRLIGWVGGSTADSVLDELSKSKLGLSEIYKFINSKLFNDGTGETFAMILLQH